MINESIVKQFLKDPQNGGLLLKSSFRAFHEFFMFYTYKVKWDWQPFHEEIVKRLEDVVFGRAKKKNLVINISPRSGKSKIMEMFEAWCFLINPYSNIIHTSYSDTLVKQASKAVRAVVQSPAFQAFSGGVPIRSDSAKAEYWQTEPQKGEMGGAYRACTMDSALTGFGAGAYGADKFAGLIVCFPYDEVVHTEEGLLSIGDIVENKKQVRVWSYNLKTKQKELKPIENWVKNGESDLFEIQFSNGTKIKCTPDHRFYTKNRGYVEARNLNSSDIVFSNAFNLSQSKTCLFHTLFSGVVSIKNKVNLFLRRLCKELPMENSVSKSFERFTCFDIANSSGVDTIFFCDNTDFSFISCDSNNVFSSQFTSGENKSSKFNGISHIFGFCSINKIIKSIVCWITVKMSYFRFWRLLSDKTKQDKLMNISRSCFSIFRKAYSKITFLIWKFFKHFSFFKDSSFCSGINNNSINTSYISKVRYLIESFVFGYVHPLFIRHINHIQTSYCLTIRDNHNMFVGKKQGVLAKNCDDPLKASSVTSRAEIQSCIDSYVNALKSRLNDPKTPIVMIMQRLDPDDLTGYVLENEAEDWDWYKIPALDENEKSFWEAKFPAEMLLKMKKATPQLFYGQYQQEPIVVGGSVIQTAWFQFYNPEEFYPYQCMFAVADTAQKKAEANDFTVISLWGKTYNGYLDLLDMVRGKYDAYELEQLFISVWNKWKTGNGQCVPYGIYIEDKSSGIGVMQNLKAKTSIPIIPIQRSAYKNDKGEWVKMDKYSRALSACPHIAAGRVRLRGNPQDPMSADVMSECAAFRADLGHKHDDICDTIFDSISIAFGSENASSIFI